MSCRPRFKPCADARGSAASIDPSRVIPVRRSHHTVNMLLGWHLGPQTSQIGWALVVEFNQNHWALHPVIERAIGLAGSPEAAETASIFQRMTAVIENAGC